MKEPFTNIVLVTILIYAAENRQYTVVYLFVNQKNSGTRL